MRPGPLLEVVSAKMLTLEEMHKLCSLDVFARFRMQILNGDAGEATAAA